MLTNSPRAINRPFFLLTCLGLASLIGGCSSTTTTPAATTTYYTQTNLVSDIAVNPPAAFNDPHLLNAWGIAFGTAGTTPWMSSNSDNSSTFYDTTGKNANRVTIPMPDGTPGGAPSGLVFNGNSSNFGGKLFIFSTEDGTLAGWAVSDGSSAKIVSDSSGTNAVYKGLAIDAASGQLYATDFHNNAVVIFDKNFHATGNFTDPTAPAGYAPFGIQNINGVLYVTFARQDYQMHDDSAGASIGFIDRFTLGGVMSGRFTTGGDLNSPWGIALAPASWGTYANAILVSNFGDGTITGYDQTGKLIGQLMSASGTTISIDGLWGMTFNPGANTDPNKLFFTAGPGGEAHGLFGFLHP